MKKIFLVFALLLVTSLQADEKRFNIKSDLLSFALDGYSGGFEYLINNDFSVSLESSYSNIEFMSIMGFAYGETTLKANWYYDKGTQVDSYYLGLVLGSQSQYSMLTDSDNVQYDATTDGYFVGLYWGKKWLWENGFNISFDLGYGVSTAPEVTLKDSNGVVNSESGTDVTVGGVVTATGGVNFGWQF